MSFCEKTTKLLHRTHIQRSVSNSIFASSTVACGNLLCRHECHTSKTPNYRTFSTTKQTRISLSNKNLRQLNLTNFPKTGASNILKIVENNLRTIMVKIFIDKTYSKKEFLEGAKQAIIHVSHLISAGNFKALEGLVDSDVIAEVQRSYLQFSPEMKEEIAIKNSDIVRMYIYETGWNITKEGGKLRTRVEKTVLLHVFYKDLMTNPMQPLDFTKFKKLHQICNYRFIKDCSEDAADGWTINKLNHFKLVDEDDD